ncbi:putative F-box domain, FBD domain, leucine-rich repeat domain, L domain-containing protein [Medicago truncatula]|uniref:F-box/RNI/FBD-like domain protein n=2 Tax=Medicago truncatula TaxID=3880 RepID=G7KF93_MEDTR|nr:F-box/FBD/LRR-repeat protein At1g13570 isoform X1 [Medicago truncatula]XP_039689985.1 F-box/FBD/LRR-repeat protein At1g13570 isoform X1 [Medicago truncatula]XP_039689986.1 F-box/FBD/LRR-repeat protein At1g13570 isoform X1 [Medicago truncatula]AES96739.1 F-box/RNI/FBD-like domain protein [Medicago truncatula]RHN55391.1 putative F-box domain, FBD domain, leucine-rich repeat domain, L domain-containing protein [Medicago truncatula]
MTDVESDRISCLPDHLQHHILSYLTIKEAGRTSVLSSKWKKKWSTQPDLVFDRQCVSTVASEDFSVIEGKFLRIIDHVLLLHSGPINKFEVTDSECDLLGVNSMADVDRWILHLTGRSVKELVLDIWAGELYKIPWCLFSYQSLHHLKLSHCLLKPPTMFKGFSSLESLVLHDALMTQDAFENLISGCPQLEKLILTSVKGFTQFNIHAPNLKFFRINGKFEGISFDNTLQLAVVYLELSSYLNSESNHSNLFNFFDHLPHIKSLLIVEHCLKYLAAGIVPVELPTPIIDLSSLLLEINFNDLREISVVPCLLKSSPNLQRLRMIARLEEQTDLVTPVSNCMEDIFSGPTMSLSVKYVVIKDISGTKSELDFIRFLLQYSPVLQKMTVKPAENVKPELMTELIRFRRASGQAEVIYHGKDSS